MNMKKLLKILAIIIAVILLILIVAPFLFKGKIMEIAKQQINKNVNAKVEFGDLGLSFIKNFPNASISLKKLTVAGIDKFEGDTLLKLNSFNVRVDIISAIKMENIKIKGIVIDRPEIYAHVLEDGSVNWDIMKEAEEEVTEEVDTTAAEFTTKIALKKFEIRDAIISYTDDSSDMAASLENFDFLLKGDMSQDFTTLSVVSSVGLVNLLMDGIRYVKDASLNMNINLDADLKNSIYILKENEIALNDLSLGFDGSVKMPNEEDIDVDMIFRTNKIDFKSLLSLVPAIYMKDFQDVKTTGKLKLDGFVRGTYNAKGLPDVGLALLVENAMFKYPDLPKSADNIQIDIKLFFDGVNNDNTKVDINKFHVELGENPIDLTMNIKTPISDLHVDGNLTASINLASLADVVPMEGVSLTGNIKSNLDMMGYLSYIENEEYEKFKADGYLSINGFEFNSPDLPAAVKIIESSFNFSPKYVEVTSFKANIGQSDMQLTGKIENFIPYMFKDETVSGRFTFNAGLINLNEFMTEEEVAEEETAEDTVPLSVFPVPSNIDFRLVSTIGKILYDKLEIDNTYGIIFIKDSRVVLENLSMDMLKGSMKVTGEYNTQDIAAPVVDFGIQATGIDIPQAFNSFGVIGELAPVAKNATGKINLQMTFKSLLDEQMNPVLNSITGKGSFSSQQIGINNSGIFGKIGKELKTNKFDNLALENIKVDFEIRDGRIYIDPFETKMKTTTFIIGGDQGIDQTMNYTININVPRAELGAGANQAINNLYASAATKGINLSQSENMNIGVNVGGTFTDPKVTMNLKDNVSRTTEEIKAAVKETVKKEIETKKEEVKAKANEEAQKVLAEAEKTAAQIRAEAKKSADAVRSESNDNADKLIKEAKNPIAKKAAEASAKKIRQEGEEKAQKIESEADTKAEKVLQEAREKAAKLQ
jgi:hypothetical protein